jgi:serine/threonine protein kinase
VEPKKLTDVFVSWSEELIDLLGKMLTLNPVNRITAAEALEHPFFVTDPLACDPSEIPLPNEKEIK